MRVPIEERQSALVLESFCIKERNVAEIDVVKQTLLDSLHKGQTYPSSFLLVFFFNELVTSINSVRTFGISACYFIGELGVRVKPAKEKR